MTIKIFNTLTGKKENFKPKTDKLVTMYVCGPTVYGPSHLGHARTYIAFDFVRKGLEVLGYKVRFVNNITDIHDDIIKESIFRKKPFSQLAKKFTNEYFQDIKKLKIKSAFKYPKVTQNIEDIIKMIKTLLQKKFAYVKDGSVYFDISKFKDYGRLSKIKISRARSGTRINVDKYSKENIADFVLWKAAKPGEPNWKSPFGPGRPGWHIECSVMSVKHLGLPIDIHGGGRDLIFPHHENEIAQSEATFAKKPFVRFWLHTGPLTVNKQKMSKSLGNFVNIPEALKNYSPETLRFFILSSHYRSSVDFSKKNLINSQNSLERVYEFIKKLQSIKKIENKIATVTVSENLKKLYQSYLNNLNDDFNSPKILASVFEFINKFNPKLNKLNKIQAQAILKTFKKIDKPFNFLTPIKEEVPPSINKLANQREKYRQQKKWAEADKLRKELAKSGWIVEDTLAGPFLKKIES